MKITAIILLSAALQVSANGISQNITLSVKDAPLEKVFNEIKKQTNYSFVYYDGDLASSGKVTIQVANTDLKEVLNRIFKDQPLTYEIFNRSIIIKQRQGINNDVSTNPTITIPPIDVTGRIVDSTGAPIAGASVQVKGDKTKGTSTDNNGYFKLTNVDEGATLIVSGVNIESFEIKVNGRTDLATLSAKMRVSESETVVVEANTGYQKVKPNEITGSVIVITNDQLNKQRGTNILERLDGITSSVLFNVGKRDAKGYVNLFSIRGLSTINGNTAPLIILDNFPYAGDINNINPNDVENITILRDAAATSIYGARGGNGVVVISTKKGRFNQKLSISFTSDLSVSPKPDLFSMDQMSSSDYVDVEQLLFNNGYFNGIINGTNYSPLTPGVEILLNRRDGKISALDSSAQIDALKRTDSRHQLLKYFYQPAVTQQYSLRLSGGSNNLAWTIGGGYNTTVSNLGAKTSKINLSFTNNYRPLKNLELSLGVYFAANNNESGKSSIQGTLRNAPYLQFADAYGNPLAIGHTYRNSLTDTAGTGKLLNWKYYPLDEYKHSYRSTSSNNLLANLGLNYQIGKPLRLDLNYQYQRSDNWSEQYNDMQSFYTRDLINSFTNLTAPSARLRNPIPFGDIFYRDGSLDVTYNFRAQINFNKSWNKHQVSALLGGEIGENQHKNSFSNTLYGYVKSPTTWVPVDFGASYPDYLTGRLRDIPGAPGTSASILNRNISVYGNATYTYKGKYSVNGSMRKDASNTFGLSTNDKWNPLWSTGVAWDLSKESFYKLKLFPILRVRATWGYSGNVDPSRTALPILRYISVSGSGNPSARIQTLNDPDLRWEKVRTVNLAIDFGLSSGRISGSLEYYQKQGTDLYSEIPYDYTVFGQNNTRPKNAAEMKGQGVDLNLNSTIIDKDVKWSVGFLYSFNTSKTTKYFEESAVTGENLIGNANGGNTIIPVVGKPLYALAAYRWGGLNNNGYAQGYLNGQLSNDYNAMNIAHRGKGIYADDVVFFGSSNPTHFGAVSNQVRWRNLFFNFNITYKLGYYYKRPFYTANSLVEEGYGTSDFAKRWQRPGDELYTDVPVFLYPAPTNFDYESMYIFYAQSTVHMRRADNVRLQFVNIGYSFTSKKSSFFKTMNIVANISNIGILWKANNENEDPDYPNSLSPSRVFTIGIKSNF